MMKKIVTTILLFTLSLTIMACVEQPTNQTTELITTEGSTELVTDNPTTSIPTTMEPTTDIPTTEDPTTEVPTTEQPTTNTPTTEEITTIPELVTINLFSINDFHGGAYKGMDMISKIGAYIKEQDGHHLEISNGDIFQGSALSNYYHGEVLVDVLNEIGFDGFVIGNHEFDWGIDVIGDYRDGDETNGELNHPVLAANIVYEDTQSPLDFTLPYIIEEFDGVRVGVIGLIGLVMDSIAASRTENIEFLDPVLTAAQYAETLRTEEDVDIVAVYMHGGSYDNTDFANLTGDQRIDAMFNGHTHQDERTYIQREGLDMPYAQMNNYDTSLVQIELVYNTLTDALEEANVYGITTDSMVITDLEVDQIIDEYENNTIYQDFINEVLTVSEGYYNRGDLVTWGASVIRDYANVDIGATNAGGFRVTMEQGEFTMEDMITLYPFDNVIKVSEMTGQQIQDFFEEVDRYHSDVYFDDGLEYNYSESRLYINGSPIVLNQTYTVGAVDYIFDKTDYDFLEGDNIYQSDYFMRDLLVMDLRNVESTFNPADGTNIK
jgi:2',3'-cyclic-nucleotide 2'-phosphodiesterase (5'-nucleotidase family)